MDLRKQKVGVELRKLGIEHEKMRVIVVMDASGSMSEEYLKGKVQETLERLVPVASRLDTDGQLEFLYYADRFLDLGTVDEHSMEGFVGTQMPQERSGAGFLTLAFGWGRRKKAQEAARQGQPDFASLGMGNNEPPVMNEVRRKHREDRQPTPTLVLFITDGGIYTDKEIEQILRDSSREDLFWQFVGLGNQNYGILRRLDTLAGRAVDNAGFFAVDDIAQISDEELYQRLLSELPTWLRAARAAGIIR
ncbi:vWA domain-containing protein [Deinococcus lacus]|uniref:VWA domain-containing protein n=1 Tax=Deinococcus lacus TaxID=392561 RepID=A0ABW1YEP0_9DEIO